MNEENKHPEAIQKADPIANPFVKNSLADHVSHGAVAIESERAIAQIQAKVIMAKRFPRNPAACFEEIRKACANLDLAESAFYSFPKGGALVNGATIVLARQLAQIWGNIDVSVIELARRDGETELQASAWDMETNVTNSVNFTVKHYLDTRGGGRELTEQRDIRDLTANIASRKERSRILAVLPKAVVASAIDMCHRTLAASISSGLEEKRFAVIGMLKEYSVTEKAILIKFDVKQASDLGPSQVASMRGILRALKDGTAKAYEIFEQGLNSKDVAERRASNKANQPAATKQNEKSEETQKPQETQKTQVPDSGQAPPENKPRSPKEGTIAWYRIELKGLGFNAPASMKSSDLQNKYSELIEDKARRDRQGDQQQANPETTENQEQTQSQETPETTQPTAGNLSIVDNTDDWFDED